MLDWCIIKRRYCGFAEQGTCGNPDGICEKQNRNIENHEDNDNGIMIYKAPKGYEVVCPDCGTIIHFKMDAVKIDEDSYLPIHKHRKFIDCPVCNEKITTHINFSEFDHEYTLSNKVILLYSDDEVLL